MELTEVEPTPYLVSRFYRAPEIVLAAKYSFPLDVFAMGCTLFELFTGKILFPGKTNNDMLRLFMEVKGKLPNKLIKSGTVWKNHFDDNMDFKFFDVNKATRKKITRTITDLSAKRTTILPTIAEDEDSRANFSPGDLDSSEEDRLREPGDTHVVAEQNWIHSAANLHAGDIESLGSEITWDRGTCGE
ncbi:Prpf4b [Symbiodinium sp. CCMP2592]|nr:Prpf4b [Symbiodinium sp. CCMP2592]